jgi:hypothetical protein
LRKVGTYLSVCSALSKRIAELTYSAIVLLLTVDLSTLLARLATSAARPATSPETVSIL